MLLLLCCCWLLQGGVAAELILWLEGGLAEIVSAAPVGVSHLFGLGVPPPTDPTDGGVAAGVGVALLELFFDEAGLLVGALPAGVAVVVPPPVPPPPLPPPL